MNEVAPAPYRLSLIDTLVPESEWESWADPPTWHQITAQKPFSRIQVGDEIAVETLGGLTPGRVTRVVRRFSHGGDTPREETFVWLDTSQMGYRS